MRRTTALALALALGIGCADSADEECDLDDRRGSYLFSAIELAGGTCGPIPTQVVNVDLAIAMGCMLVVPDDTSADQCRLARTVQCPEPAIGEGVYSQTSAITDDHGGGDLVTGTLTITVFEPNGTQICKSTYEAEYARQ